MERAAPALVEPNCAGLLLPSVAHELVRALLDTEEVRENLDLAERLVERRDQRLLDRGLTVDRDEVAPRLK